MEETEKIKERKEAERRFVESKHQLIVKTWHLLSKLSSHTK